MSEATRESVQRSNGKVETSHHPETDPKRKDKHYYGIPPIKHAHWTWQIPVYFWIGGIGAGTQLFSTVAQLLGHEDAALKRASRYTVLVTMILSPIFLIWDLGRPERFYNMMRILKLRSPMSTQSWSPLTFGNLGGLLAARQAAEDGLLGSHFLSRLLLRIVPERLLSRPPPRRPARPPPGGRGRPARQQLPLQATAPDRAGAAALGARAAFRPLRRLQHRQPHKRHLRPDLGPQLVADGPHVPRVGHLDGPLVALARTAP